MVRVHFVDLGKRFKLRPVFLKIGVDTTKTVVCSGASLRMPRKTPFFNDIDRIVSHFSALVDQCIASTVFVAAVVAFYTTESCILLTSLLLHPASEVSAFLHFLSCTVLWMH